MRAGWLSLGLVLAACTAAPADPCADVVCEGGVACDPATGRCAEPGRELPALDDLDLGRATRGFPAAAGGLVLVGHDRGGARLLAVALGADLAVQRAVVIGPSPAGWFDAAVDGPGRLVVLAPDASGAGLRLSAPFDPGLPPAVVPFGAAGGVHGAPALALAAGLVDVAFADPAGDLHTVRFELGAPAPSPERVVLPGGGGPAAEPRLCTSPGGGTYLFYVDEAGPDVLVAGRETGVWRVATLHEGVRRSGGPTHASAILPDGNLAALAVDGAGRLVLAVLGASGVTRTIVDDGEASEPLRRRVGAWPWLGLDGRGLVRLGAWDATDASYRTWTLDATGAVVVAGHLDGVLLAPTLVAGPAGAWLVGGVPTPVGTLWTRRLSVRPLP